MWRRILTSSDPLSSKDFIEEFRKPLQNIAYHMSQLLDGGAITLVKAEPKRGSTQRFYGPTDNFDRGRVLEMIAELNSEGKE
jgi:hypothetical protein